MDENSKQLLLQQFLTKLDQEIEDARQVSLKAAQKVDRLTKTSEELREGALDLEMLPFTVKIYDPWDASVSTGHEKSCEAGGRAPNQRLASAIGEGFARARE